MSTVHQAKKLVLLLITSLLMTVASMKIVPMTLIINEFIIVLSSKLPAPIVDKSALLLKCISCIYHLVWLKKKQAKIQILLDSGSEVNTITLAYTAKLGFKVQSTNVEAQKINGSTFETFRMVLTSF